MELQTVSQVSKTFGISAQMLRYYERSGLLKSLRKDDYAYRVYDDENIKRLQQIIILRKLQIPVKQICVVLNSPGAATAIEIFKANISELQAEINALETIKSALEIFVAKIAELAAVRLNLNLITDESVMKLAESLSLIQKNVKEIKTMNDLNMASETISRAKENLVRVVYRASETVAKMWCEGCDPPDENAKNTMEKFIRSTGLFERKPDFKVFSHGVGDESGAWFFVTIPDDLEVSTPFEKAKFEGGLWAVVTVTRENNDGWAAIDEWIPKSDKYSWNPGVRPRHEVYFNPLNVCGLQNTELFNTVFNHGYLDIYIPIKEIEDFTIAQPNNPRTANQTIDIDLAAMVKRGDVECHLSNGLLEINAGNYDIGMSTSQNFNLPFKIELRLKPVSGDFGIKFANGGVLFQWDCEVNKLYIADIAGKTDYPWNVFNDKAYFKKGEFVDIELTFDRDAVTVKVNDEIRFFGDDNGYKKKFSGYINKLKENPDITYSSPVSIISAMGGTTVVVESLKITEI